MQYRHTLKLFEIIFYDQIFAEEHKWQPSYNFNMPHTDEETSPSPIFKRALKIYFTSVPSDWGLGNEHPKSLGIKAIFAKFLWRVWSCVRFPYQLFFLFFKSKIFYDLIWNSRLPTVARPIKIPYSGYYYWVLYGLERKFHLNIYLLTGRDVCPPLV